MAGVSFEEVRARLAAELQRRDGNVRGLAREIAATGDVSVEMARRAIYRILRDGQAPTPETSAWLEQGLRRRAGYFTVVRAAAGSRRDRLEALEEEVRTNIVSIEALREACALLLAALQALGATVPDLPPAALPPEAGGTRP